MVQSKLDIINKEKVGFENNMYQQNWIWKSHVPTKVGFENHMYQQKMDLKTTCTHNKCWVWKLHEPTKLD